MLFVLIKLNYVMNFIYVRCSHVNCEELSKHCRLVSLLYRRYMLSSRVSYTMSRVVVLVVVRFNSYPLI